MKKLALAALAAVGLAGTAQAGIVTLNSVTPNASDFTFSYEATLGPDEGVRAGDRFVIFDFAGYVAGSIFSASANLLTSVENLSPSAIVTPGFTDDALLPNLVFTYTGPNSRTSTGPLASFTFPSIGARSIFGQTVVDAFFTLTTKNNPSRERGRPIYTLGETRVPGGAVVPEPATWAMLLGGFGMMGAAIRRRERMPRVTA